MHLCKPLINNRKPPALHLGLLPPIVIVYFDSFACRVSQALPSFVRSPALHCRVVHGCCSVIASPKASAPIPEKFLAPGLYPQISLHQHRLRGSRASLQHIAFHPSRGRSIYPPIHNPGPAVCPDCVHAATKIKGMHATPQLPPTNLRIGTSRH